MDSTKKAKLKSKKVVIPVTTIIVITAIGLGTFAIGYGVVTYEEPEFINQCIDSHIEHYKTSPTYICNMWVEGVCMMQIPVGGGQDAQITVCDEYDMVPNPKYVSKDE